MKIKPLQLMTTPNAMVAKQLMMSQALRAGPGRALRSMSTETWSPSGRMGPATIMTAQMVSQTGRSYMRSMEKWKSVRQTISAKLTRMPAKKTRPQNSIQRRLSLAPAWL